MITELAYCGHLVPSGGFYDDIVPISVVSPGRHCYERLACTTIWMTNCTPGQNGPRCYRCCVIDYHHRIHR